MSTGVGYALASSDEIISSLFAENDVGSTYSSDAKEISALGKDEEPFKNLYLFMYQNVKIAPQKAAVEAMVNYDSDYHSYSIADLEEIAINGNIERLANQIASDQGLAIAGNITGDQLVRTYSKIRSDYERELQIQRDNRTLSYENLAQEIFINHDLSDSANIDLLYDFDQISFLLFGEYVTVPDRTGTEDVNLASEEIALSTDVNSSVKNTSSASTTTNKLAKVKRTADTVESSDDSSEASTSSGEYCVEESDLSKAVAKFEEENPESDSDENSDSDSPTDSDADSGSDADESGEDDSESGKEESGTSTAKTLEEFNEEISGKVGNWDRELPCGEIFCITVELVDATEEPAVHEETDNCIACHIEYISKRMEETTSKSLVAGKVPMNVFEDGTCKEAGKNIGLNMNVYAVSKPIFPPQDESTPEEAVNNVNDLRAELAANRALTDADSITGQSATDVEAERILYDTGNMSQSEAIDKILSASNEKIEELDKIFDEFELNARAQNYQNFERQVASELSTFKAYFESFEQLLKETITPLQELNEKKTCQ